MIGRIEVLRCSVGQCRSGRGTIQPRRRGAVATNLRLNWPHWCSLQMDSVYVEKPELSACWIARLAPGLPVHLRWRDHGLRGGSGSILVKRVVFSAWKAHKEAAQFMEMHLFTDCKSLYDHIQKEGAPKPPSEKRLALDLAAIRQALREGDPRVVAQGMRVGRCEVRPAVEGPTTLAAYGAPLGGCSYEEDGSGAVVGANP